MLGGYAIFNFHKTRDGSNNLTEARSLIEMITGVEHVDLNVTATVPNAMAVHRRLTGLGSRWMPRYKQQLTEEIVEIDCSDVLDDLRGKTAPLAIERVLTRARLPSILEHIQPGSLIYTHYVGGIVDELRDAITKAGWRVGVYSGDEKDGLRAFLRGEVDVLIGTRAMGAGVDGLQKVSNRLIVNSLPWTAAEYEQLVGRIYRQGQEADTIEVILPVTYADLPEGRWSWCQSRLNRIRWKKSLADCAVDGVAPQGRLVSIKQATEAWMGWLERLEDGETQEVVRPLIKIPLEGTEEECQTRARRYGDFSTINNRWNRTHSSKLHERLQENPEEWAEYHSHYKKAREDWPLIPYEAEAKRLLKMRRGRVVGDFGCGEALLAEIVGEYHRVHSFDHVAIDETVTSCDMTQTPLEDGSLDVAIFSLSLMGSNQTDYLREAHRCLAVGGELRIVETAGREIDEDDFRRELWNLGFDLASFERRDRFVFASALRADRGLRSGVNG